MFGMFYCFNESHPFFDSTHLLCADIVVPGVRVLLLRVIVQLVDFLSLSDVEDLLDLLVLVHYLRPDSENDSIMEYFQQIMKHMKDLLL